MQSWQTWFVLSPTRGQGDQFCAIESSSADGQCRYERSYRNIRVARRRANTTSPTSRALCRCVAVQPPSQPILSVLAGVRLRQEFANSGLPLGAYFAMSLFGMGVIGGHRRWRFVPFRAGRWAVSKGPWTVCWDFAGILLRVAGNGGGLYWEGAPVAWASPKAPQRLPRSALAGPISPRSAVAPS